MEYEFEFEDDVFKKTVQVFVELDFTEEPHPANAGVKSWNIAVSGIRAYDSSGRDVTLGCTQQKVIDYFRRHYEVNALERYLNEG